MEYLQQLGAGMSDVRVISDDGSPHGPKSFVLWNPPLSHPPGKSKLQKAKTGPLDCTSVDDDRAAVRIRDWKYMSHTEQRARRPQTRCNYKLLFTWCLLLVIMYLCADVMPRSGMQSCTFNAMASSPARAASGQQGLHSTIDK